MAARDDNQHICTSVNRPGPTVPFRVFANALCLSILLANIKREFSPQRTNQSKVKTKQKKNTNLFKLLLSSNSSSLMYVCVCRERSSIIYTRAARSRESVEESVKGKDLKEKHTTQDTRLRSELCKPILLELYRCQNEHVKRLNVLE